MTRHFQHFGDFVLDCEHHQLTLSGHRVELERMPLDLLMLLVERQGELVERGEIIERLWGKSTFVDSTHGINTAIKKVRLALRDDPEQPRFIQTVKGRGYRFIAPVMLPPETEPLPTAATQPRVAIPRRVSLFLSSRQLLATSIAVVGIVAAIIFLVRWPDSWFHARTPIRSLAVLPLVNLSNRPDQEYFADGLTDEIITDLAQIASLRVISHTSVMPYKNTRLSLPQVARALNVDAIVEGSVLRVDKRIRITVQLLDGRTDRHLWARSYARDEGDVVAMQSEVAWDIGNEIVATLQMPVEEPRYAGRSKNPEAYDNYLRGRYFWNKRTLDSIDRSIEYFRRATQADPRFAQAYAALGDAYVLLDSYGGPGPSDSLLKARAAAEHALQLNSKLAEAYTVLGAVKSGYDLDWDAAERDYRRALALDPNYPTAHHWYGLHLARMGRFEQAQTEMRRALELDPLSLIINVDAADVLYCARRPDLALEQVRKALQLDANFAAAHLVLGKIHEAKGEFADAASAYRTASRLFGQSPNVEALRAHALARWGRRKEARAILAELLRLSETRYISGVDLAIVYCGLRQQDDAIRCLQKSLDIRDKGINIIGQDPLFDDCRSHPGFQQLLRRLKLAP